MAWVPAGILIPRPMPQGHQSRATPGEGPHGLQGAGKGRIACLHDPVSRVIQRIDVGGQPVEVRPFAGARGTRVTTFLMFTTSRPSDHHIEPGLYFPAKSREVPFPLHRPPAIAQGKPRSWPRPVSQKRLNLSLKGGSSIRLSFASSSCTTFVYLRMTMYAD